MKRVKENIFLIFYPLKEKKTIQTFAFVSIIMALIYWAFTTLLVLLSFKPFPKTNILGTIWHAAYQSLLSYTISDICVIVLYSLVGGLLFANYSYWKCGSTKSANAGILASIIAATACPACLLPLIGFASFAGFLTGAEIYLKIGILLILIFSMYYVAITQNKKGVCKIKI
jgi:hypothetical protein